MKKPVERKVARLAYYARNIARDSAPQFLFRRRLEAIIKRAELYDPAYLSSRLNYYNKLSAPVETPFLATVGSIPMAKSMYYYDLKEHARYFPRALRLNYVFGDLKRVPEQASIVKSRPIAGDNRNSVVMKLVKFRNFYFPEDRTPFEAKKPIAIWRGGVHNPLRRKLVDLYRNHPLCDVGYTHGRGADAARSPYVRPRGQMAYRYVISIEGNDMATNLKWILASNSLCLMPRPKYETWFMEGRLAAGQHYVELRDDFADLEEKIVHYENHTDEALSMIANANDHVRQFLDRRCEQLLSLLVMYKYFVVTGQLDPDPRLADLMRQ